MRRCEVIPPSWWRRPRLAGHARPALLEARGCCDAPLEAEQLLTELGFAFEWVERSHIWPTRRPK